MKVTCLLGLLLIAFCVETWRKMGKLLSLSRPGQDRQMFKVSFVLTFVIAGFNWYGNHILVRSAQHLTKK